MLQIVEADVNTRSVDERGPVAALLQAIDSRRAVVGIVGLGYVGLPLALTAVEAGFRVTGFDVDQGRIDRLNDGEGCIKHISDEAVGAAVSAGRFIATADFDRLDEVDVIMICVPTPLTLHREPDLRYVVATAESIAARLRPGQLVVLESTTYPGTTIEVLKPILERGGLKSGTDFLLAYSPEREDPGNVHFNTADIPKIIGGDGPEALDAADAIYGAMVVRTVRVSTPATAEAVKLSENIFRAVNIALVNELKIVYKAMGVDIWEVIDAAKTKPFGFMPFYPGPGLGGHCIPIDPFYLTWKAREYDLSTRFIELAGEINTVMPAHIVSTLGVEMDRHLQRGLNGSKILVLGVAYKKNVDDLRESPSLKLMELLEQRGAAVQFHDPHIAEIMPTREHASLSHRRSVPLTADTVAGFDCVLIATDHDVVDYDLVVRGCRLIIDTRNACGQRGLKSPHIIKA